eukprot:GHRR01031341.1.p1 GENE.GHRR01031341.1~~GHRR01031341.1.p1  ORF type:complete len:120 (-),score=37.15 GHRR01031341.1:669-1028(-)
MTLGLHTGAWQLSAVTSWYSFTVCLDSWILVAVTLERRVPGCTRTACSSLTHTQVEVSCAERGRAMAYAWNCSIGASEAALVELRARNQQLLGLNSQLAEQQAESAKELKGVDFLRYVQ